MRDKGKFGRYGGVFAPEVLMPVLEELEEAFYRYRSDKAFAAELKVLLERYAGRPTPLTLAQNLSRKAGGCRIYLKREDLLHGGAHKTNNCLGQALLARHMGKRRLIAETGAGQHGFATAMVGALFGFETVIYMGEEDTHRQKMNVLRMRLCGAEVVPVATGSRTLKDAVNEAMRDWSAHVQDTFYLFGTTAGPHPFPTMVKHFQSVIGREALRQVRSLEGRLPDAVVACVGGGSNALGIFNAFLAHSGVKLYGVEGAGEGLDGDRHSATLSRGTDGVLHGAYTRILQDADGQIREAWSISAGLDYPGVGPEHSHLRETGRVRYVGATDREALDAFVLLSRTEGIIPALESSHAIAYALKLGRKLGRDAVIVVNLSGRGDKDLEHAQAALRAAGRDL
ncbi:MAG: tryptophan synthase subunit beta [bacterium]